MNKTIQVEVKKTTGSTNFKGWSASDVSPNKFRTVAVKKIKHPSSASERFSGKDTISMEHAPVVSKGGTSALSLPKGESVLLLSRFLFHVQEAFIAFDEHNRILAANQELARLLGHSVDELLEMSMDELMDNEDFAKVDCFRDTCQREYAERAECRFIHRDGRVVWGMCSLVSFGEVKGFGAATFALIQDVTESRQLQQQNLQLRQELEKMRQELDKVHDQLEEKTRRRIFELSMMNRSLLVEIEERKKAQDALGKAQQELTKYAQELESRVIDRTRELQNSNAEMELFCYTVSHDLRAPLRAMQGFANILLEDYTRGLNPTGQDFMRRIVAGAARMDRLISDLLAYSRVGRMAVDLHPVCLQSLLEEVLEQFQSLIRERKARVAIQNRLPLVLGQSTFLFQVVENLLSNGLKFVPPDLSPEIRIGSEEKQGLVRFWIADNGIGIDTQYHQKIFRIFERLHGARDYEGTGIGLAIVRKSVERMNGKIGVESAPGKGSTFWVELASASTSAQAFPAKELRPPELKSFMDQSQWL